MDKSKLPGARFMRSLAGAITDVLPKGLGFALVVFQYHKPGIANYISSAERDSMIEALRETLHRLESKQDFQTPEEN